MKVSKGVQSFAAAVRLVAAAAPGPFALVLGLFGVSALGVVLQLLIGRALLDDLVSGQLSADDMELWFLMALGLVIFALSGFATSAAAGMHRLLAERLIRHCGEIILSAANRSVLSDFDSPDFHDHIQHARRDHNAAISLAMSVPNFANSLIVCIGISAGLLIVSPLLLMITLVSCVPLWIVGRGNSEEMYSFTFGNTPNDRSRFRLESIMYERENAAEVRAFNLGGHLSSRWSELYQERIAGIKLLVRKFLWRSMLGALAATAVLCAVLGGLFAMVNNGQLGLGAAATACIAIILLAQQSQRAATSLAETMEHRLYLDKLNALKDWRDSPSSGNTDVGPLEQMRVADIKFSYPTAQTNAVDGVTFEVDAGEVIAVVGHNGSGKTTLAKLLCGLYEPTKGSVQWIDRNGQTCNQLFSFLEGRGSSEIGVVFQDYVHYWFSARENISVGNVRYIDDTERVVSAAKEAGIYKALDDLPYGLDTPLATELEGGVDLSVGQWQKIAIARVVFRGASFIVLDEPTASLDAEAEAEVFETIRKLRGGRTVVLISHRFSTVRSADRILVMSGGHLVEEGHHDELMMLGGEYSRMYRIQSSAYVD